MTDLLRQMHRGEHSAPHGLNNHLGRNFLREEMCKRYQWLRMTKDIDLFKRSCEKCATASVVHLQKGTDRVIFRLTALLHSSCLAYVPLSLSAPHPLHPVPVPKKVWSLVSMDLITGLPKSPEGYINLLTMIDYFSKWPIAKPLRSKKAKEIARALMSVYAEWGVPDIHLSDQGTEFCNRLLDGENTRPSSRHRDDEEEDEEERKAEKRKAVLGFAMDLNRALYDLTGTYHRVTTPYHPAANGMVSSTLEIGKVCVHYSEHVIKYIIFWFLSGRKSKQDNPGPTACSSAQ